MTGSITVKRHDYPERTRIVNRRTGKTVIIPAFYECHYYWNGNEIAFYNSRDDVLYLNTAHLSRGKSLSYFERMRASEGPEMWVDLVQLLKINSGTKLRGYFNI